MKDQHVGCVVYEGSHSPGMIRALQRGSVRQALRSPVNCEEGLGVLRK